MTRDDWLTEVRSGTTTVTKLREAVCELRRSYLDWSRLTEKLDLLYSDLRDFAQAHPDELDAHLIVLKLGPLVKDAIRNEKDWATEYQAAADACWIAGENSATIASTATILDPGIAYC